MATTPAADITQSPAAVTKPRCVARPTTASGGPTAMRDANHPAIAIHSAPPITTPGKAKVTPAAPPSRRLWNV